MQFANVCWNEGNVKSRNYACNGETCDLSRLTMVLGNAPLVNMFVKVVIFQDSVMNLNENGTKTILRLCKSLLIRSMYYFKKFTFCNCVKVLNEIIIKLVILISFIFEQ